MNEYVLQQNKKANLLLVWSFFYLSLLIKTNSTKYYVRRSVIFSIRLFMLGPNTLLDTSFSTTRTSCFFLCVFYDAVSMLSGLYSVNGRITDELENIWKKTFVAYSEYYPGICLEGLRIYTKMAAGVPAEIRLPEYESGTLPLCQPARSRLCFSRSLHNEAHKWEHKHIKVSPNWSSHIFKTNYSKLFIFILGFIIPDKEAYVLLRS
jgi:hypothetical protein